MTNLFKAEIMGRQYRLTKEFFSEEERIEYLIQLMSQPQWQVREVYNSSINLAGVYIPVYCVDVESVA